MNQFNYQEAFGAEDRTTDAMQKAIGEWYDLYYGRNCPQGHDPGQRVAYTIVSKLVKTMFGEYQTQTQGVFAHGVVAALNEKSREAMHQTLVGGECYLKPWVGEQVTFGVIPRCNALIFGRNGRGEPVDMGIWERSSRGKYQYTLLERRYLDEAGHTVIENRLFRSANDRNLGQEVPLSQLPDYAALPKRYVYPVGLANLGLVRIKTPGINCVDGSWDGVSVYAEAVDLIRAIDENEAQLIEEFRRGESRIIASADMLRDGLQDHLFVGMDDDPQNVGIHIFSPQLREASYLHRKQEYLRNVESVIGLKRGMLSDANEAQKTATEIASSAGDFNLTVMEYQRIWEKALADGVQLCIQLAKVQGMETEQLEIPAVDWGNGVLYDEDKTWADYMNMVSTGLVKPEIALAWRFGMQAETEEDLAAIRQKFMPEL